MVSFFIILYTIFFASTVVLGQKTVNIQNGFLKLVSSNDVDEIKNISKGTVVVIKTYKNCASCFTEIDDYISKSITKRSASDDKYYSITLIPKRADPIWAYTENKKLMPHIPLHYFAKYTSKTADSVCLLQDLCIDNNDISPIVVLYDGKDLLIYGYKDLYNNDKLSKNFTEKLKMLK